MGKIRIVNPYNIDEDDDALFAGALSQGLIYIEEYDDDEDKEAEIEELDSSNEIEVHTLSGHTNSVNGVAISDDFVISASSDKTLRVWNWKTGQHLRTLIGHTNNVNQVVVNSDFVISASSDKTLRVWNWKTGQHLRTLSGYSHELSTVALDGDSVFAVSFGEIWIWNWKTGEHIRTFTGWHRSGVESIAVDRDFLLSASPDLLLVRNWKTDENLHKLSISGDSDNFAVNGDFAVFINSNYADASYCHIDIWNWRTGEHLNESDLRNKKNDKINKKVFLTPYHMCFYNCETNKWYFYSPNDGSYNDTVVFTGDYSHFIRVGSEDSIGVMRTDPSLQRFIGSKVIAPSAHSPQAQISSSGIKQPNRENKLSNSPTESQKPKLTTKVSRNYGVNDVLQAARDFIQKQGQEWVNFTSVSQYLCETFYELKSKPLGQAGKIYKSLVKFLTAYPSHFELRQDDKKKGLYWVRLKPIEHKQKIVIQKIGDYTTDDVLQAARDFIQEQGQEWMNFNQVSKHLCESFYELKSKPLGQPGKVYKSILKFIATYPSHFELRQDDKKMGLYWIRLKSIK